MSKKNNETVVIRADMTKTQWTIREMKKYKVAYLMVAPFFILFFMFTVVPVVLSFLLGFTTFNMLEWPKWVFMDNYIRLFLDDEIFLLAIKNTLVFAAVTGPGSYLLSLFFAWFINELRPKIRAFVTLLFYAPSISGSVYLIWTVVFSGDQYGFAHQTGTYQQTYSVVPERKIHRPAYHSGRSVDQLGYLVPHPYRRLPGR